MGEPEVVVEAVCISTPEARVRKEPQPEVYVGPFGLTGDRHAGQFRWSVTRNQPIPNRRQWSAVSSEEVAEFCQRLGVQPFPPGALGENLRLRGLRLGDVLPGTIFEFPSGARLLVVAQNDPCQNAADELSLTYGPYVQRYFVKEAYGKRGVVGSVLVPGTIRPGDRVTVIQPEAVPAPLDRSAASHRA